ncbi:MAG: hypothetical protein GOV01_04050 [Candidatus Altiarchaeota archaeon]|nr:hypothetical protein [Candidatus Altiarchaeota archaeon]
MSRHVSVLVLLFSLTMAFAQTSDYLKMEWGTVPSVGDSWVQINFTYLYDSPVIVASIQYTSLGVSTVTRIANISSTNFTVRLQDTGGGAATIRDVHYLIIEEGNWTLPGGTRIEAQKYNSTQTDNTADWSPVAQSYISSYTSPVVTGQVMSYNDTNWSVFWASGSTSDSATDPNSTDIATGKHVAEDPSTTRNYELMGFIVAESGHGTVDSVEYDFFLSLESVQGVGNNPPYSESFTSSFSSTPEVAVVSSSGMRDSNGGWPVIYGTSPFSTTQIDLAYEEYDDAERAHTTERVASFVFETSGDYVNSTAPTISNPQFNESQVIIGRPVQFTINVTNNQGGNTTSVNATFRYPNTTLINTTMSLAVYPFWQVNWTDTSINGTFNVTDIWVEEISGLYSTSYNTLSFDVVDVAPLWSLNYTSVPGANRWVEHGVLWKDGGGLSGYVFSFDNCTGNLVNDSWATLSGISDWSVIDKVVNDTVGCTVQWQVFANDTYGEWNATSVFTYLTVENDPPKWYQNSTNDTTAGEPIEHRVLWKDGVEMSGHIFSFDNCTGSFVNDSWVSLSGATSWVNITKSVSYTKDCSARWQVFANDSLDNWNYSDVFTYQTIWSANLKVNQVISNNSNPTEGEFVFIQANISNPGPWAANESRVWFNSTDSNGVQTGLGEVYMNMSVGSWAWVNVTAAFGQGTNTVNASVYTPSNVVESDFSNNWNETNITVSSWVYLHGNVSSEIILAIQDSSETFQWSPQSITGNVFIVDYDADVDFSNLKPLNESGDFWDLDSQLGNTGFDDNVEKTYDTDNSGSADTLYNFTIYGTEIIGVPVVNASDGSPWYVGLLWDADDGGTEYDGTQDVVFIIEINVGITGAFGTNDYEAKAPSNLESLTGSLNFIATRIEVY